MTSVGPKKPAPKIIPFGPFHDEMNQVIETIDNAIAENAKVGQELRDRRAYFEEGRAALMSVTDPATIPVSGHPEAIKDVETP